MIRLAGLRRLSWPSLKNEKSAKVGLFQKGYNGPSDFVKETKVATDEVKQLTRLAVESTNDNVVENIDNLSNRLCLTGNF